MLQERSDTALRLRRATSAQVRALSLFCAGVLDNVFLASDGAWTSFLTPGATVDRPSGIDAPVGFAPAFKTDVSPADLRVAPAAPPRPLRDIFQPPRRLAPLGISARRPPRSDDPDAAKYPWKPGVVSSSSVSQQVTSASGEFGQLRWTTAVSAAAERRRGGSDTASTDALADVAACGRELDGLDAALKKASAQHEAFAAALEKAAAAGGPGRYPNCAVPSSCGFFVRSSVGRACS